jgi:hypothetical protein
MAKARSLKQVWPETRRAYLIKSAVALLVGYLIGSRAIHTGSLWQYALAITCTYLFVHFLVQGVRVKTDGKRR